MLISLPIVFANAIQFQGYTVCNSGETAIFQQIENARRRRPRNTNEGRMLHLIRHRQPISRIELARATGLGPGTVSIVVNRLLSAGFLSEGEAAPSSGGRRAQYIQMNAGEGVRRRTEYWRAADGICD